MIDVYNRTHYDNARQARTLFQYVEQEERFLMLRKTLTAVGMAATFLFSAAAAPAMANDFPDRPITIVVPFPPGGTSDLMGRTIAKGLTEQLGESVIVENKGGGGTLIGSQYVARSKPDGYTLLLAATPHAINQSLYKNIPYNTLEDFRTIAYMSELPLVVAVPADSDIENIEQLIEKAQTGELTYGSSGVGGSPHLATELFLEAVDGDAVHVPYRGSNPSVMDLAAGRTDFAFDTLYLIMTQVETGKLRPLAQTGEERHPTLPDVPTIAELGYPDVVVTSWFSLAAPSDTPEDVMEILNIAINNTLKDDEVKNFLDQNGMIITGGTIEEAQERLQSEIETWAEAVEISGAEME